MRRIVVASVNIRGKFLELLLQYDVGDDIIHRQARGTVSPSVRLKQVFGKVFTMIKTPRYQVVSTFLSPNRPFARPAHFTNKAIALAFAAKQGHTAVVIDRKLQKKIYARGLAKV